MSEFPYVSCLCPTYNRPTTGYQWLLEETIESFIRQDYPGAKELIILNDTPGQRLVCDVPGVRIINLPARVRSLGEKYNLLASMAVGSLLCSWEDDDINLPWRISTGVEALQLLQEHLQRPVSYYNPGAYFALPYRDNQPGELETRFPNGVGHNCSIFTREAWTRLGGYPTISGAQDREMDRKLKADNPDLNYTASPHESWAYIYRWGVQPHHLSGVAPHDDFYQHVGTLPIAAGEYRLMPNWRRDYMQMVNQAMGWDVHPQQV